MLLKTRFYIPPIRQHSVKRQHLVDRLSSSSGGELVLVCAPAGYGKSTLVSQWLRSNPHTFTWLALDQAQSSLGLFWKYVISALQSIQPAIGHEALQLLEEPDGRAIDSVVISLLNDLDEFCTDNDAKEPITLVLDDFHLAQSPSVLRTMNLFLDHLPPSVRLVLTTRTEPSLALPRRRANNQLLELGVEDLIFQPHEGRMFFNQTMGLTLDETEITSLCTKTEGWIAGLQLVALSLQKPGLTPQTVLGKNSVNRHISDYLFDEVFSLQAPQLQEFLVITASVPKFCAGLSNALVERGDGLAVIAQLDQLNLFLVPLDNHGTWFRYHDLFRQFLLRQFHQLSAEQTTQAYQRGGYWLEQAGYLEEALDQSLQLKDWPWSVRLLEQVFPEKQQQGQRQRLFDWVEQLPAADQKRFLSADLSAYPSPEAVTAPCTPINTHHKGNQLLAGIEPLTRREAQVMQLVSEGLPNKHIADQLNISINTLKVHIRNLYGKMGVENRTQALLKMQQSHDSRAVDNGY